MGGGPTRQLVGRQCHTLIVSGHRCRASTARANARRNVGRSVRNIVKNEYQKICQKECKQIYAFCPKMLACLSLSCLLKHF